MSDSSPSTFARARERIARRLAGRARSGGAPPWVVAQEQPAHAQPPPAFRMFAVIGAWTEEDVIAATVANAFAQGCEKVFLVDNDSRDGTVAAAVAAGATLAESFATDQYDEVLRLEIMNRVVAEASAADGGEHIWWLWLDADEFPHGPRGLTVRDYVAGLDRVFRVVGGRFINHFPDREPAYISGFHPLEFQPLCEEHVVQVCSLGHRKHPLQRFDRGAPPIVCGRGFHAAVSEQRPLTEPTEAIYLHHFPYREPAITRRRLATLCATDATGATRVVEGDDAADGMVPRFQTLDAVYRGDWGNVRNYRFDGKDSFARPVPWPTIAGAGETSFKRWYTAEALDAAKRSLEGGSFENTGQETGS